jgi:hypothetical protein
MFSIPKTIADIDNIDNINQIENMFGQTYLHILVQSDSNLLDYFLTKNPSPNIQNKDNKTPIFYAKDVTTVGKLIKQGASILVNGKNVKDVNTNVSIYLTSYINKIKNNIIM